MDFGLPGVGERGGALSTVAERGREALEVGFLALAREGVIAASTDAVEPQEGQSKRQRPRRGSVGVG